MDKILDISFLQLLSANIFVIILLVILYLKKTGSEWELLLANVRMTIQLIIMGYVLTYVFKNPSFIYSLVILFIMILFAIQNIYSRVKKTISVSLKIIIAISMFSGTVITITYFISAVVKLDPWYMPDYFIPLSGMLIGNSMTGISLGIQGLINGIEDNRLMIENALMLGGRPELILKEITSKAFYNAVLPTINSMMGMGIVFLPGMMTGQILAGAAPLMAIKYQIAIMLGILGSVTLTVYLLIKYGSRTFFNKNYQLVNYQ